MKFNFKTSRLTIALSAVLGITACGGGSGGGEDPVTPTNTAPTISGTPVTAIDENQAYSFSPAASDVDGDSLTYSVINNPAWLSINSSSGELSGTPDYTHAGVYEGITVSVSDGPKNSSLASFSINVIDVFNLSGKSADSVVKGQAYSFTPSILGGSSTDTFSSNNLPAWLTVNAENGELSGTPTTSDAGSYEVTITANNGISTIYHSITITVTDSSVTAPGDFVINGKVIDGYISGANVFVDFNNNSIHDVGEPNDISSAVAGEEGSFSITVSEPNVSKLVSASLVAELGSGKGIEAFDIDRGVDFRSLPIMLMGISMLDVDTSTERADVMITPFSHLVQQLIIDSAETSGVNLSDLNVASLKVFIDQAKLAVTIEQQVDLAVAMSDFFADNVDVEVRDALAAKAKALIDEIQLRSNDSDNDGVSDFDDAFPENPEYQKDTDNDGIADKIDTDIDGDGLVNTDDPTPNLYHQYEIYQPAPRATLGDICVGDVQNDELLCLNNGEWAKPTTYAGKTYDFSADTIIASNTDATNEVNCIITKDKVYCEGGTIGLEFDDKYGPGLPAYGTNPIDIQTGYSYICFLADNGVECFDGLQSHGLVTIEQPEGLSNVTAIAGLESLVCAIADNDVKCWGSDSYNIVTDVNATSFNNPKNLYNSNANICIEDAEGVECWGATERGLDQVNYASSTIKDVSFNSTKLCVVDDTGAHCFGGTEHTTASTTTGDIYDRNTLELLLDLDFVPDPEREGYVIPIEMNAYSEQPAAFIEGVDSPRVTDPFIEVPELSKPTIVDHFGNQACFSDDNGVQCNYTLQCHASGAKNNKLVSDWQSLPESATVWLCDESDYQLDISTEYPVQNIQMRQKLACVFTVAGAHCESKVQGGFLDSDRFDGDIPLPEVN